MTGVVKLVPVPREVPPVATSYQLMLPDEEVAESVTVPASHREPGVVDVIVAPLLTVRTAAAEVSVAVTVAAAPTLLVVEIMATRLKYQVPGELV
jgi:hypothetical protein